MQDKEEKILDADESNEGQDDGPARNERELFTDGKRRIGIAAGHVAEYTLVELR